MLGEVKKYIFWNMHVIDDSTSFGTNENFCFKIRNNLSEMYCFSTNEDITDASLL